MIGATASSQSVIGRRRFLRTRPKIANFEAELLQRPIRVGKQHLRVHVVQLFIRHVRLCQQDVQVP